MNRRVTAAAASGAAAVLAIALGAGLDPLAAARLTVSGGVLGAAAILDLAERRIPNRLTLPALPLLVGLWLAGGRELGQIAAGLLLAAVLVVLGLVAPAALGMGDAKLALVIAFGLTDKAPTALALALLLAAAVAATRLLAGRDGRRGTLPLAPFLAAGALIALLA